MRIYFSGEGAKAAPEVVLGKKACVMLTYHGMSAKNQPDRRFARILAARRGEPPPVVKPRSKRK